MNVYTFAFETRQSPADIHREKTSVWLWDICKCGDLQHNTGFNIESFIAALHTLSPCIAYSHALRFDSSFIFYYLLSQGWEHTDGRNPKKGQFTTLIAGNGDIFQIRICFENGNKKKPAAIAEIRNSQKKVDGTVRNIAAAFGQFYQPGRNNSGIERPADYIASEAEISLIRRDTRVMAKVIGDMHNAGMTRITTASDSMQQFKDHIGRKLFKTLFPVLSLDTDKYIRKAYRGGICQLNPEYKGKIIDATNLHVYDVNSLYPYVMIDKALPYDQPIAFDGRYKPDPAYPLYIQRIEVCCSLRDEYFPTLLKNTNKWLEAGEYLETTGNCLVEFTLTSIDLELLRKHYNIWDIKYLDGIKFRASAKLFKSYLSPLFQKKTTATGSKRELYKRLLNALSGKFASNPKHTCRTPEIEGKRLVYTVAEDLPGQPVYTALTAFVTAYARRILIHAMQQNADAFIYCDTDSIHLNGLVAGIERHPYALGKWKLENADKCPLLARYYSPKCYITEYANDGEVRHLSGVPYELQETITLSAFSSLDEIFALRKTPSQVEGGAIYRAKTI